MNLLTYHGLAMRTAKQMNNKLDQLVHAAMGCASEPGELAESALAYCEGKPLDLENINEELGDGMWFTAYCCDVLGLTLPELCPVFMVPLTPAYATPPMLSLAMYTLRYNSLGAAVATLVKAHAFYGKQLNKEELQVTLKAYLESIAAIAATVGLELDDILTANIAKLALRYPGKYSDEAAIARADKEAEALEVLLCPTELTAEESAANAAPVAANFVFSTGYTDALKPESAGRRFTVVGTAADFPAMQEQMKQQMKAAITAESEYEVLAQGAPLTDTGIVDYD